MRESVMAEMSGWRDWRQAERLRMRRLASLGPFRVPMVIAIYMLLVALAMYLGLLLRFDGDVPRPVLGSVLPLLPALVGLQALSLAALGVHRTAWRYTGIWDLRDMVVAMTLGAVAFFVIVYIGLGVRVFPRSVLIVGTILGIVLLGGVRLAWRLLLEVPPRRQAKRVLVFGAGTAGESIVRDMHRNGFEPIGFVDDDPAKAGQRIHRVRVLGSRADLSRIMATEAPDEVLVAIPSAGPAVTRALVSALEPYRVPITTLPPLREILDGHVTVNQVRRLAIEDLLTRLPVQLDLERARELIGGRRVLVTGAGGSIGSELSRQIAALGPERLVLYERYENNLYTVLNTLQDCPCACAALGDVTDASRLRAVMAEHQPAIVFHAAAHKHVPLMELNPCEAVKNNIVGTRRVAEAALQHEVERFVLISTDKAVNPSSLMGVTKRVAELLVQAMPADGPTTWSTVRFGNVLGSNGSVVPRWLEQIGAGGPVTVTHADVRRYFMLIPEAVQLILQAASVAVGRDILILEMGEQIRLLDMARTLIRLSGFVPDVDMPIEFVGLRPGEKLHEELVGPDEVVDLIPVDKVLRVHAREVPDAAWLLQQVTRLSLLAADGRTDAVIDRLRQVVPTYQPGEALRAQAALAGEPLASLRDIAPPLVAQAAVASR